MPKHTALIQSLRKNSTVCIPVSTFSRLLFLLAPPFYTLGANIQYVMYELLPSLLLERFLFIDDPNMLLFAGDISRVFALKVRDTMYIPGTI